MENKNKAISSVMVVTTLSKCLGFLRDLVLAFFFGTSIIADAYIISQTIPEFLFSLVVQAIAIGFIPIYIEIKIKKGKDSANEFTNNLYIIGLALAFGLIILTNIFANFIVKMFASGFTENGLILTTKFIRISIWGIAFRIISSIDSAFLNANKKFLVPATLGIVTDVVSISTMFLSFYLNKAIILAYGITFSYLAQMLLQFPLVFKLKGKIKFGSFRSNAPYFKKILLLFLPLAIGVGANQINILIDRNLASLLEGGISSLNYACKITNIIENIIVLSLATVMFPTFSKHVSENKFDEFSKDIGESILIVFAIMIPCAIFVFLFSPIIVKILFENGAFDSTSSNLTSTAMKYYSLGVLFIGINAILTRALYSLNKAKFTIIGTCISVFFNVILNIILSKFMGIGGIALATSISNFVLTCVLAISLIKMIGKSWIKLIYKDSIKYIISSFACFIITYGLSVLFSLIEMNEIIYFIISCLIGLVIYILICYFLKAKLIIQLFEYIKKILRRRSKNENFSNRS